MDLLDIEAVRDRFKWNTSAETTAKLEAAIKGVEPRLESILATHFGADDYSDIFEVDSDIFFPRAGLYRLRCSNAFIDGDSVEVFTGSSISEVLQSTSPIAAEKLLMKPDQLQHGIIMADSVEVADKIVRVSYTAGYDSLGDLPQWVTEAAFLHMLKLLTISAANDMKAEVVTALEMMGKDGVMLVDRHLYLRNLPGAIPAVA